MKKINNPRLWFFVGAFVFSIIFPVIGLFISAIMYFFAKDKKSAIIFSILFGVLVGFFAYNFVPDAGYDLSRHQQTVVLYSSVSDIDSFADVSKVASAEEILPQIYSFIISRTGDINLLQFFPVTIGYAALFYILVDYKNRIGLKNSKFIPLFVLVLFGQSTLYYFSGLYNYLAINLFALAFYLEYIKEKKVMPYIIYTMLPFLHISMIFPVAVLVLYKIFNNKNLNKFVMFAVLAVCVTMLFFVGDNNDIMKFGPIRLLTSYSNHNDHYMQYYDGVRLVIDLIKLLLTLTGYWILRKEKENIVYRNFLILLTMAIIVLLPASIVMIRFASLVLFLSAPMLMDIVNKQTQGSRLMFVACASSALLFAIYNIRLVYPCGYEGFIVNNMPKTLPEILTEERNE